MNVFQKKKLCFFVFVSMLFSSSVSWAMQEDQNSDLIKLLKGDGHHQETLEKMSQLLRSDVDPNAPSEQDELGFTPLHYAVVQGIDFVSMLLHFGADPTIPNSFGTTAEDLANKIAKESSEDCQRSNKLTLDGDIALESKIGRAQKICMLIQEYKSGKKLPKGKLPYKNYQIISSVVTALNTPDSTGKTPLWQLVEKMVTEQAEKFGP